MGEGLESKKRGGFDWDKFERVLTKLEEKFKETKQAKGGFDWDKLDRVLTKLERKPQSKK